MLQLNFNFEKGSSYLPEDFLVSSCNVEAFSFIEKWPDWLFRIVSIHGSEGAGKTHLLNVWARAANAVMIDEQDLTVATPAEIMSVSKNVALDVEDKLPDEEALFHLINMINEERGYLVIASRTPPARWEVTLRDLWSRLRGIFALELKNPDEETLYAILLKEFSDRELRVKPEVIKYILERMPRSFKAAIEIVRYLDNLSIQNKSEINLRFVRGNILFGKNN